MLRLIRRRSRPSIMIGRSVAEFEILDLTRACRPLAAEIHYQSATSSNYRTPRLQTGPEPMWDNDKSARCRLSLSPKLFSIKTFKDAATAATDAVTAAALALFLSGLGASQNERDMTAETDAIHNYRSHQVHRPSSGALPASAARLWVSGARAAIS